MVVESPVEKVNSFLAGSPYSLPSGADSARKAEHVLQTLTNLKAEWDRSQAALRERAESTLRSLRENFDIDLVYQSNAIEGSSVTLAETANVISRIRSGELVLDALLGSLAAEPNLEVAGHYEALELIRQLSKQIDDRRWRITVTDIRAVHQLVMVHEPRFSGSFKTSENMISGSDHRTTSTFDVQRSMVELVDWLADTPARPTLQATVAHAWLTHIHPFEDGNGRVARLLANLVLYRYGWPAIVIKSESERELYLDALRHSDEGGDILPLFDLFVESLRRSTAIYSDPTVLEGAIEADISGNADFDMWLRSQEQFTNALAVLVRNYDRAGLELLGWPGPGQYLMLTRRNAGGNTTLAKLRLPNRVVQLWIGYTTEAMTEFVNVEPGPSLFISERWDHPGFPHPWKWSDDIPGHPVKEVCVRPAGLETRVHVRSTGHIETFTATDGANFTLGKLLTWSPPH